MDNTYLKVADAHAQLMLDANRCSDNELYYCHLDQLRAALVLLTEGDTEYAYALENTFHDSNESFAYYTSTFTRDDLINGDASKYELQFVRKD